MAATNGVLPYFEKGIVVSGFGRGSKRLGVPTANFSEEVVANLPVELDNGVYFGFASVSGGPVHPMVMSVGWNPTYNNEKRSMETHVLHVFPEDFYGEELRVCIVGFLREELKFTSEQDLITAIHKDIEDARRLTADPVNLEHKKHSFFSE